MQRFLHEIRSEFPAFETCTVGEHLLDSYFVRTYQDNERIKRRSGLFLICGLDRNVESRIARKGGKIGRIDISAAAKRQLLKELAMVDISSSKLYPDFERRAMELAHKRVDWVPIGGK